MKNKYLVVTKNHLNLGLAILLLIIISLGVFLFLRARTNSPKDAISETSSGSSTLSVTDSTQQSAQVVVDESGRRQYEASVSTTPRQNFNYSSSQIGPGGAAGQATNISLHDLLDYTNRWRSSNGLSPLTLSSKLNTSALNKAQDMEKYDYWEHTSPSGIEPWFWFEKAGYGYIRAGENLAYGFDNSSGVLSGWMNSPEHRSNVLGDYVDVGFGIVNCYRYQGVSTTIVVAHYGTPK